MCSNSPSLSSRWLLVVRHQFKFYQYWIESHISLYIDKPRKYLIYETPFPERLCQIFRKYLSNVSVFEWTCALLWKCDSMRDELRLAVWLSCSCRVSYSRLLRTMPSWILGIYKDQGTTASLGFWCFITFSVKKVYVYTKCLVFQFAPSAICSPHPSCRK